MRPAARQAHSSPWQVPMPTRVRRRRSTRLFTERFSSAYSTSPIETSSHSHTRLFLIESVPSMRVASAPWRAIDERRWAMGLLRVLRSTSSRLSVEPGSGISAVRHFPSLPIFLQMRSVAHSAIRR